MVPAKLTLRDVLEWLLIVVIYGLMLRAVIEPQERPVPPAVRPERHENLPDD